jgi:hypothetical protein
MFRFHINLFEVKNMAPWSFHVLYHSFDVTDIHGYSNELRPIWEEYTPNFGGDIHFAA